MLKVFSLMFFFNMELLDPWLIILIGMFNVFEVVYWLFLANFLSITTGEKYTESLSFVFSTYGVGFLIYILFAVFIMLYMF